MGDFPKVGQLFCVMIEEGMYDTVAWAKTAPDSTFSEITIGRNIAGPDDVTFKLKYCGICHTDVHVADNDLGRTQYPCVPGHELAGIVSAVGSNVTEYKVGDRVGVGCIVDSCFNCYSCKHGVRLAKAMGNTVTAISTSPSKEAAAREIGAKSFVVSTNEESMTGAAGSLDLILNTISASHDLNTYLPLLARRGVLVQLGLVTTPHPLFQLQLMPQRKTITGSLIGGLPQTQECIDFCHKHNIVPNIKIVTWKELDGVYTKLKEKNDTIIRNVLDIEASKNITVDN